MCSRIWNVDIFDNQLFNWLTFENYCYEVTVKTTERGLSTAHSVHLASTQHDRQGIVVFYIDFNLIM